jgi:hypothetical protein
MDSEPMTRMVLVQWQDLNQFLGSNLRAAA